VSATRAPDGQRLTELLEVFGRLGFTAFGGPAAHIAMMRDEVVRRRAWMSDSEFVDLLAATNLIPGPNSTEMAIHIGARRAGAAGLVVAGAAFILPATFIVGALAWAYVRFGAVPQVAWLLYGIKPVIIAVVVHALWGLVRTVIRIPIMAWVAAAALAVYLMGVNEIAILIVAGVAVMAFRRVTTVAAALALAAVPSVAAGAAPVGAAAVAAPAAITLPGIFLLFAKIGSVLYGSGYVLLAFLHGDLVERLRWLTDRQLLDAVAIGQFTPGPVFTTATFVGYLLMGPAGAAAATLGIFLPAFVFVAISAPLVPRIRRSPVAGAFLDGVNAASLALMAGVSLRLAREAIVDPITAVVAVAALAVLVRTRINSAWLVAAGAVIGFVTRAR
jgi:chromate transporter